MTKWKSDCPLPYQKGRFEVYLVSEPQCCVHNINYLKSVPMNEWGLPIKFCTKVFIELEHTHTAY